MASIALLRRIPQRIWHDLAIDEEAMAARILIVEDEPMLLKMLCATLEREGYEVAASHNGLEALEKIRTETFDLILTDIWMPQMNGIQLLEELKKMDDYPRVVVITADTTSDTLLKVIKESANRYVFKPVSRDILLDAIQGALEAKDHPLPIEVVSNKSDWIELLVPCNLPTIEKIHSFMIRLDSNLPLETREQIAIAFRELLLNAAEWGGRFDPSLKLRISCLRTKAMILYRIKDPGGGFKIEDVAHAAFANPDGSPFAHMQIREEKGIRAGGFGIMTVRALVDDLLFNEAHNEVVFIKYLDRANGTED